VSPSSLHALHESTDGQSSFVQHLTLHRTASNLFPFVAMPINRIFRLRGCALWLHMPPSVDFPNIYNHHKDTSIQLALFAFSGSSPFILAFQVVGLSLFSGYNILFSLAE
jgi:hypothetical protein